MRTFDSIIAAISGAAVLTTLALVPAAQAQQSERAVEEIIVTAQKRDEALTEIPMSVTVLSGDFLERVRADSFEDFVALIPGFSLESSTAGVNRITLRGINTGGVATTVGVYVNDVPFGSSSGLANAAVLSGNFDTFDVARIEVLRGPQGTLYGASALGGVMKYVTNAPDPEAFEARGEVSLESVEEGGTGYNFTGLVNVPVSDRVAVRASGFYRHDDGYIDSIGNNPIPSLTVPGVNVVEGTRVEEDINSVDVFGGRISALFNINEDVSLDLTAFAQNIESDASNVIDGDPLTVEPVGDFVRSRYHEDYTDIEYRVYSATLDWDLGGMALQSVTSYSTFDQDFQTDVAANTTLLGAPVAAVATLFFGDAATRPLSAVQRQVTNTDKLTQEFRLISPESETFEWLVGLYYTDEDSGIDPQSILAVEAGTDTLASDIPTLLEAALISTYEEYAVFANATWYVTPRFELSFGARASDNDQEASQTLQGALLGGSVNFEDANSSESPFTWSFSPRLQVNDNVSVYGRVATGYRPGGPNVIPAGAPPGTPGSYESDELTNYEVGIKADALGGILSFDAAAYFLDWEDVQLLAVVNGVGLNANGGTAESRGMEVSATLRPTDGLTLSFNSAYTDAELTQDTDPVVGGTDGDPLPFVPEWSFGLNGEYTWPVLGDAMAYVGANLGYVGDRTAGFGNRLPDGSLREADAYTTLNARAGIDFGSWSVELYGNNLGDEDGINDINTPGALPNGLIGLALIRPRTVGISVGARF
ncbi:TonB-dependent receptor [Lentisalinibacter orientalis]|uniref:TonB-dependent receptor n=1 Tax=Lentisalinibacter orientalis TaxID=2992241 RepID=UPI003864A56E